jgi:hypothetical protein
MSIRGRGLFVSLIKNGHTLREMGLDGSPGDVMRLSSRIGVAKSFRGLVLEGVEPKVTRGYSGLMQVFLVHSALEQYVKITCQRIDHIEQAHASRGAKTVVSEIFAEDKNGRFFEFVHARLKPIMQTKLTRCQENECCNVGIISGAIRHIFAHGYLGARNNKMQPAPIYRICQKVSTFLLDFMDEDFDNRMKEYARGKSIQKRG